MVSEPRTTLGETATIGGRYELLGLLGSGGMGIVYRVRDRQLDEIVALKTLRHDLAYDPQALARFRREVKLARRVTHRNVARTFDLGEDGDLTFLTMELVEGESLSARLARKTMLPIAEAAHIACEIAAGLAAAHAAGIVHRDLKPDNVLLAADGRVVVTDFGVAFAEGIQVDPARRIVGTPAYMAPEQLESPDTLDARADVYALGLVLYEMLTGELPWSARSEFALAMVRLSQPPPNPITKRPDVPPDLAAAVLAALAKDRDERTPTASAFAEAVHRAAPSYHRPPDPSSRSLVPPREAVRSAIVALEHTGSTDDDYVTAGIADRIVDGLASQFVRARVCPAALLKRPPHEAGRELEVDAVVTGRVTITGDTLEVNARLVTSRDGLALWAQRLSGTRHDALSLAASIAREVAQTLTGRTQTSVAPRESPEASDLLIRGRRTYHRFWRTAEAVSLLTRAQALAPDDPRIASALALALTRETGLDMDSVEARRSARAHATHALALAPSLPDAHVAVGVVNLREGEIAVAAASIRRALDLSPGHVDALEHAARILLETSALEEGIAHAELAMRVEPLLEVSLPFHIARARALMGEWDAVDAIFRVLPSSGAARATYWLTRARLAVWRNDEREAEALIAGLEAEDFPHKAFPMAYARFARDRALGPLERQIVYDRARSSTSSPRQRSFFAQIMVELQTAMGDVDGALVTLTRACEDGLFDVAWLDGCSALDPLRDTPTFRSCRALVAQRADALVAMLLHRPKTTTDALDPTLGG